ncbi:MAG: hypothetical protein U0821_27750 [Chloroflexota bacterium]
MIAAPPATFCPFKGLEPYTEADRRYYFGREREADVVVANLYASRLTIFYGASGVGKSSLLLAGVLPKLHEASDVAVTTFRDWRSGTALAGLKQALARDVPPAHTDDMPLDISLPLDQLVAAASARAGGPLFLILDQFEEYALYQPEAGTAFDDELARVINNRRLDVGVLISLREDHLGVLDRFQGRIANPMRNLLRLEPLSAEAAEQAIRRPLDRCAEDLAARGDLTPAPTLDDDLVTALVDLGETDHALTTMGKGRVAENGADGAPVEGRVSTSLLQVILTRLWRAGPDGAPDLSLEQFVSLGGAEGIAAAHLTAALEHLSADQRTAASRIFRYLVTPAGTKIAQQVETLADWTDQSPETVRGVLDTLAAGDARVIRRIAQAGHPVQYELYHDVLARGLLDVADRYEQQQRQARETVERERALRDDLRQKELAALRWKVGLWSTVASALLLLAAAGGLIWYLNLRTNSIEANLELVRATASVQRAESQRLEQAAAATQTAAAVLDAERARRQYVQLRELTGHNGSVFSVAFNGNGSLLASASEDGTARLWGIDDSGIQSAQVLQHEGWVLSAAFAANSDRLITASWDGTARVWEPGRPAAVAVLAPNAGRLQAAALSPDGRVAASGGADGVVRLYDVANASVTAELQGHERTINGLAFGPRGDVLISVGDDRLGIIWFNDGSGWSELIRLVGHSSPVIAVAISNTGDLVATASADKTIRLWSPQTGEAVRTLNGHTDRVLDVGFSEDDQTLISGSQDDTLKLWHVQTGTLVNTLPGGSGRVQGARFRPRGDIIATGGRDRTVRIWAPARAEDAPNRYGVGTPAATPQAGGTPAAGQVPTRVGATPTMSLQAAPASPLPAATRVAPPQAPQASPRATPLPTRPSQSPGAEEALGDGVASLNAGDPDAAIQACTRAIEISPTPRAFLCRGLARDQKNLNTDALADYTEAIRLDRGQDPEILKAFLSRGLLHANVLNNCAAAIPDLEHYLQTPGAPFERDARAALATCRGPAQAR